MLSIRLLRPILHFLLIIIIFYVVYNIRSISDWIPFIHLKIQYLNFKETMIFWIISAFLFPLIWFTFNLYKLKWPIHNYYNKFIKVFINWFIIITFIAYFWKDFIFQNWISRLIIIQAWIISFFWLLIIDFIINLFNSNFEKTRPYEIWTYKTKYFKNIKEKFKNYNIYKLEEFKDFDDIRKFDIIFIVWNIPSDEIEKIMDIARFRQIEVFHIPDVNFLEDVLYHQERIWPMISWKYKASPLEWWWKVAKRLFDIIFSLGFISIFSWLYILIILRIYFNDKWKVFYVSERIWQWWKKIKIYKFRTMIENADKIKNELKSERDDILFKMKDDPRIKLWWKILRKTSLDEIPQFLNVLKWDMSVVWPRPHLEEEIKKYEKWQKRLLAAKPWITGYAQVFGRNLPFKEEAKLDLYRFQNWSVWLDIVVIIWVFRVLFKGE